MLIAIYAPRGQFVGLSGTKGRRAFDRPRLGSFLFLGDHVIPTRSAPAPQIRQEAAEAIGDRGEAAKPALGVLRQMLRDPDAKVQYRAAVAIGQLTGSIPEKPRTIQPTEGRSDGRQVDEAPD